MIRRFWLLLFAMCVLAPGLHAQNPDGQMNGIPFGRTLPGLCNPGQTSTIRVFYLTQQAGGNAPGLYTCTAVNTWTLSGTQPDAWSSSRPYNAGDIVSYMNVVYVSKSSGNRNNLPTDTTFWAAPSAFAGGLIPGDTFFTMRPVYDVVCTEDTTHDTAAFNAALAAVVPPTGAHPNQQTIANLRLTNSHVILGSTMLEPRCKVDFTAVTFPNTFNGFHLTLATDLLEENGSAIIRGQGLTFHGDRGPGALTSFGLTPFASVIADGSFAAFKLSSVDNVEFSNLQISGGGSDCTINIDTGPPEMYGGNVQLRVLHSEISHNGTTRPFCVNGASDQIGGFDLLLDNVSLAGANSNAVHYTGGGLMYLKNYGSVIVRGPSWFSCGSGDGAEFAVQLAGTEGPDPGVIGLDMSNIFAENCGGGAFRNQGNWDSGTPYVAGAYVNFTASDGIKRSYEALLNSTNVQPDTHPLSWEWRRGAFIDSSGQGDGITLHNIEPSDGGVLQYYMLHQSNSAVCGLRGIETSGLLSFTKIYGSQDGYGYPQCEQTPHSVLTQGMVDSLTKQALAIPPAGIVDGRVKAQVDDVRRDGVATTVAYPNLANYDPTTWGSWNMGVCVNSLQLDYLGGMMAGRVGASSGVCDERFYDHSVVLAVGDYLIARVAAKTVGATQFEGATGALRLLCIGGNATCVGIPPENTSPGNSGGIYNDGFEDHWEHLWGAYKVTASNGMAEEVVATAFADPTTPTDFAFPIVIRIPASEAKSEADALDIVRHLSTYSPKCTVVGEMCTVNGLVPGGTTGPPSTLTLPVFGAATTVTVGDGAYFYPVPAALVGKAITSVTAQVNTPGTTGPSTIQLAKCAAVTTGGICSSTVVDILSTPVNVDSGQNSSATSSTPAVINGANATLAAGDVLRVDVDTVSGTPPVGLSFTAVAQ